MNVVVAPAPFKGSLSAVEAAEAMALGVRAAGAHPILCPVADGGEGTLDALVGAAGGIVMGVIAHGPLGVPVRAHLGQLPDGTGVVELAQASGLQLLGQRDRDPMRATSRGTGELIKGALARRPSRIIVGLGGSATVDGGTGLARALGVRFLDDAGAELPPGGGSLERLARIDTSRMDARVGSVPLIAAADVASVLLGEQGAARAFGPQKGATPKQVEQLERGLANLAVRMAVDLKADVADLQGAGAAGGAGAMLAALGAELRSGVDVVLDAVGFRAKLEGAGLVLTGEGKLDAQTLAGKAPMGVARAAAQAGVPCAALVGDAEIEAPELFAQVETIVEAYAGDRTRAMREPADALAAIARSVVRSRM